MNQNEVRKKIFAAVDNNKEEITRMLQALVRIPTLVGDEGEGQKLMNELFLNLGLKVIVFEADYDKVSRHKAFSHSGYDFKDRPNIIGILEGSPSAKSLKLSGHIDVVPVEPAGDWEYGPWEGKVVSNRLYGRGALDMKAGLVTNYFALKSLLEAGLKPDGTVILESVIEEEAQGGGGTLACLMEGYTADGLVISEPSGETITIATAGVHWFRVRVTGKPAHAGRAHVGVNAILKMNKLCQALEQLDVERGENVHYPLFEEYSPRSCHLNIGTYKAGDWPSTVPSWAEIECRIGSIPGEDTAAVKNQVEATIKQAAEVDEWLKDHPPEIIWFGLQAEPWAQDPKHPLVTNFKSCAGKALGKEVVLYGAPASADTQYVQYFDQPALIFGPRGNRTHATDEYVDLDSVVNCTKVLASFMMDWCRLETV
ncbi:MAG: ArgE/DapE family deacylase [Deltaproteobacteria bacterium]|nr:ArgE/DapE family deacylase [Deltaproteobacteria bacterium]